MGEKIGSGQFGEVFQGKLRVEEAVMKVAVKTLKEGTGEEGRIKFLQEAAIMGQFKHPNVICMYGLIADGEQVSQ